MRESFHVKYLVFSGISVGCRSFDMAFHLFGVVFEIGGTFLLFLHGIEAIEEDKIMRYGIDNWNEFLIFKKLFRLDFQQLKQFIVGASCC